MRIDLGCGPKRAEGFIGFDRLRFPGVDVVADLSRTPWIVRGADFEAMPASVPRDAFEASSGGFRLRSEVVQEARAAHFIEHLNGGQRIAFANELHRVLVPGARAVIVTPHWAGSRAYGDMTHQWPPVSEFWYAYLSRAWRLAEAPHDDASHDPAAYDCDFGVDLAYTVTPQLAGQPEGIQAFARQHGRDAVLDLVATLTRK